MIHINFLAASRIQAAIECLPATCAEDHNDPYLAGQGEIEVEPTREERIASEIYGYLSEQSLGEPFDVDRVMALLMTAVSVTGDKSVHLHGDRFGRQFQDEMQKMRSDHSSESP